MRYYMAPLEGVTTWTYRKTQAEVYGSLDKYFIPFIECHEKRDFKTRERAEILPEHNEGLYAVPQILTNRADGFLRLASALKEMGYEEVNLNLGCPSKTVVSRGKRLRIPGKAGGTGPLSRRYFFRNGCANIGKNQDRKGWPGGICAAAGDI